MAASYFSVSNSANLGALKAASRIHIIGVSGVAMAQIAVAMAARGFIVTGSDTDFYEPMGSLLRKSGLTLFKGYAPENIPSGDVTVVIGNAVSYGNPEVLAVESRKLPYTSFAQLFGEIGIGSRHSIVVSGCHGKSTTSAITAYLLVQAKRHPSYFVGAVVPQLSHGLMLDAGDVCVVEGDEYDTAFFAKTPKFHFYRGKSVIITSIEYDHADIYPDLESIEREFTTLVKSIPSDGVLIACNDCQNIRRLLLDWRRVSQAQIITYGVAADADYKIIDRSHSETTQKVTLQGPDGANRNFETQLVGLYNAKNALAAMLAAERQGCAWQTLASVLRQFQGIRRRQELRFSSAGIDLIEDFAHHPTAVRETLTGLRERYPSRRIVVAFEPRSNTSRRKVFENEYIAAFDKADVVLLCAVVARHNDSGIELIDVNKVVNEIAQRGVSSQLCADDRQVERQILELVHSGDVIVLMSNGSFNGLIDRLIQKLGVLFPALGK